MHTDFLLVVGTYGHRLLRQRIFSTALGHAEQWNVLQQALETHLQSIGETMAGWYAANDLAARVGDDVLSKLTIFHPKFASVSSLNHASDQTVSQADVIPLIPGRFDFASTSAYKMHGTAPVPSRHYSKDKNKHLQFV